MRPPPTYTLFPYTTLFRSLREEVESLRTALTAIEWPDDELAIYGTLRGPLFAVGDDALLEYRHRIGRLHPFRVRTPEDRKSTRLNSSHLGISYAVFCLKKK